MPVSERTGLDESTVTRLLENLGILDRGLPVTVEALSGGVANSVLAVSWDGGDVVVKQALPRLRVQADWPFDPRRTSIERECLDYLATVLPAGSVPDVVAFDAANDILVISRAPRDGVVWKRALLEGDADPTVGAQTGALLGAVHRASHEDEAAGRTFAAKWPLLQGRTDPFHRTVATRHPELRDPILAEVERLEATNAALVLGDFSPKNIIVYPDRAPLLLDFEVAHYGDPAFDVAFLLTHLALKARHRPEAAPGLGATAASFLRTYGETAGPAGPQPQAVVAELGCLLLSRIDGKSPVEYIDDEADRAVVREVARALLLDPPPSPERAFEEAIDAFAGGGGL